MGTQRSEDFRDWDIEVGVNYSGLDQLGLPFCIWREKADNRLIAQPAAILLCDPERRQAVLQFL